MTSGRILPRPDADTREYWAAAAQGKLLIQRCEDCETPRFYPRLLCPKCHSQRSRWDESTGAGAIHSFSIVHRAPLPEFRDKVPYVVALIDLDDGVRMFSNITGTTGDALHIGARVRVTFRKETDEIGIPEFELIQENAQQ
ncbi:Zn-ribbon domain-containing OB-fold protein [Rhodococcus opacus]|uniref:Zn-ribbon domain-containing OB-fold protein n=1 Tax=Rhodococcus opacus TaxID=37919 RepID=UPI001C442E1F|nr:Zn-ribbon domain-containing OB-fold protein [Rhodococcus opacus]MBV6756695.1 Zn-ribbon domain-containing OB-fold protein [Rhodococcus opacus]